MRHAVRGDRETEEPEMERIPEPEHRETSKRSG